MLELSLKAERSGLTDVGSAGGRAGRGAVDMQGGSIATMHTEFGRRGSLIAPK